MRTATQHAPDQRTPDRQTPELPGELDEFFGHGEDIERICQAVARRPLVTVVGPGGSGKSRIALRVARILAAERFAVAGWITPEDLADEDAVRRRIAGARSPGRTVLLVVDGCEHAVQPCARALAALAAEHPDLRLLATSREALRTGGELVHPVGGLPLPPFPDGLPDLDVVRSADAVRLFLDRARSAGHGIVLTAANAAAVVEICRGLDGNPLAIELAASLTAVLSVADIANRLDQCLDLLTRGYRTARPHQHSLQACLDHSVSLLSGPARELLDRLGVFRGDFTLAAVEVVCPVPSAGAAPDPVSGPGRSLIDVLTELVDKHLVTRTQDWFRLSAPVRHFALRNLHRTGRYEDAAVRHTAWCGWLAERIAGALDSTDDIAALALLTQESDNLASALRRVDRARPDPELTSRAARIAEVLVRFWLRHDGAAARTVTRGPLPSRRDAADPGADSGRAADHRAARFWLERHLADAPDEGPGTPLALALLSVVEGDHARGREQLRLLCGGLAASGRRTEEAFARCALAVSLLSAPAPAGDDARGGEDGSDGRAARAALEAEAELDLAVGLYRAAADEAGTAFAAAWLALASLSRGDTALGRRRLYDATALVADCGDDVMAAPLIGARARLRLADGRHSLALELAGAEAAAREPDRRRTAARAAGTDPGLAAAWRALGPGQALEHWEYGRRMALSEALDVATDDVGQRPRRVEAVLSPREIEVVRLVAKGMTSTKIARTFVISPRTVDTHVDHVRTKLGLHSRAEVAAWASSLGI